MIIEAEYIGKVSCPQCASTQLRTKDRTYCGHILDFRTRENTAALIDRCTRLMVFIPDSQAAREADLDRDRSAEVRSVNRAR
jgi:alpha-acetolactate decarboxylase